jgi:murein DD-endopeptidase MepM/ murein hydrolase activator NlpD
MEKHLSDDSSELQPIVRTGEQSADTPPAPETPPRAFVPPVFVRRTTWFERVSAHVLLTLVVVAALTLQTVSLPDWRLSLVAHAAPPSLPPVSNLAGGVLPAPAPDVAPTPNDTVVRAALPQTIIPDRPRRDVITYTVQSGDTLFGIAFAFGLQPETILWSNPDLQGNPHLLSIGQVLNILPVNGVYHTVVATDTLASLAETFKVDETTIQTASWNQPYIDKAGNLQVGANLVIPDGKSEFVVWQIPEPTSPGGTPGTGNGTANVGSCGAQPSAFSTGHFIWPTDQHWVSGNPYASWHQGVDLRANLGDNIYAADNGTVLYAGWTSVGYGNLVVVDHNNGWQTWYGHLSEIDVLCGENVWQGEIIGLAGSTGHSTGPHLHFETRWHGTLPNPLDVLPPP